MSITTETGLGTKDKPEDEDSLLTTENQSDVARGITLISDLVSEVPVIDDGELMQKMKESGISHEDAQTALTKAFESNIIAKEGDLDDFSRRWDNTSDQLKREWELPEIYINKQWEDFDDGLQEEIIRLWAKWESTTPESLEGGPGSGPQGSGKVPEEYDAYTEPHVGTAKFLRDNPMTESRAKEIMMVLSRKQRDEDILGGLVMSDIASGDPSGVIRKWYNDEKDNPDQAPAIAAAKREFEKRGMSIESKAQEEGMGSVSGPPAGTEPTVREEKDNTFVLPADSNETIPDKDLQQKTARIVPKKDLANRELTQNELGEVSEIDSIMLNESYIHLDDILYRPRYTSEEAWSDDLIFENKFYTSEGVGNCQFCKGAGKVTVERLGLKECPDCDGTGDVQGNPMAQDPTQDPLLGEVPEVPNIQQEEVPDETEQKKTNPFANGESKKRAREEGTSDGAKKGWLTRQRGGKADEPSTSGLKDTIDDDEPYVVYKDYGQPVASYTDYKEAVKHSDDIGGSVSDNSDEGNILYFAKGWDGQPDTHKGSKTVAPRKKLPSFIAQRDIHSMGSTDSGGIGEIPAGVQHSKKETLKHFAKIQERERDTYEYNTNDHTKQYYYQFEADDLDYFSDEELYSTIGAGSSGDFLNALNIEHRAFSDKWEDLSDDAHKQIGDAFRDNPVAQTHPNYNGWVETSVTFKSYPDNYVNASNLSPDDAGMGVRTSNHEVRFHNRSLTRIVDDKADSYSGESKKSCKPCRKTMAHEASVSKFKSFINSKINILQNRAKAGESVSMMYGLPTVTRQGRKIKGTLAYAGVSLNDRIYLPEELAKGDGLTLPLLLNHSSIAGAEDELDRLDDKMLSALHNEEDYEVGEVTLTWDASKLTLFYTGVVENEFFQKEIDDMDMAVSLGIYYDSDSPRICDVNCYTLIKGAEFREVSLVYHAGFPIATIEAVEAQLKAIALKSIEKEEKLSDTIDRVNKKNEPEGGWNEEDKVEDNFAKKVENFVNHKKLGTEAEETDKKCAFCGAINDGFNDTIDSCDTCGKTQETEAVAEEEQDDLARGGSVDVEEIKDEGPAPTIDLNDEWEGQTIVTEMFTPDNFSVRGVMGMTISNANGVERYTFDPTMNYGTNTVHFDTYDNGATIYGESLQPKMGTPDELTKEIESYPDIVVEDADKDAFESVKKKPKKQKKRG